MTTGPQHAAEEKHGLEPMQYVYLGIVLTVITIVELFASLSWADALGDLLIPVLIVLSGVKFVAVVAYYMHLRFENPLLVRIFAGSFLLAGGVLIALISLFWTDVTKDFPDLF